MSKALPVSRAPKESKVLLENRGPKANKGLLANKDPKANKGRKDQLAKTVRASILLVQSQRWMIYHLMPILVTSL